MSAPPRSHASVRSYYFRELCAEAAPYLHQYDIIDWRIVWRKADAKAHEWRRQATNIFNPATRQWEQRT